MEHPLSRSDAVIGFGSHDLTTPLRCAEIYLAGYAPVILFTGKLGKGTQGIFSRPEAEIYAGLAIRAGVPPSAILMEPRATNTGENIRYARAMFSENGLSPRKIIAVHKPYMTRRVWASLRMQWPEVEVIVAPGLSSLHAYLETMRARHVDEDEIIHSLVGDFQRMDVFAKRGYQIQQEIPKEAMESFRELVRMGYDKYVEE